MSHPDIRPNRHVKASGILGNLKEVRTDFFNTMTQWHRQYGDWVAFRLGLKSYYLISHPALAEEILIKQHACFSKVYRSDKPRGLALILGDGLLTSQGELWQQHRRIIQPVFLKSNIKAMVPQVHAALKDLLARWYQKDNGSVMDVGEEMMRLTLDVITRTMFNARLNLPTSTFRAVLATVLTFAQKNFVSPVRVPLLLPTNENQRFKQAFAQLKNVVIELIEARRREGIGQYGDFLDVLLQAKSESGRAALSDQQIINEALTIFSAGHETTANALSWTLYLLSQHPTVMCKLQQEVDQCLASRLVQADDLTSLPYLKACFDEAMRLYPPAVALLRQCTQTTQIAGQRIKAGAVVFINVRNIHHHPGLWDEPEQFYPERFLPNQRQRAHRLDYVPFGAGARVCIGNHFALMEARLILATLVQHFTWQLKPGFKVEEQMAVTLRPKAGIAMHVSQRAKQTDFA